MKWAIYITVAVVIILALSWRFAHAELAWSNVSITDKASPSRKAFAVTQIRKEVRHATHGERKRTLMIPTTVKPTSPSHLSNGRGDSPPPQRIIDLLDQLGWVDYMLDWNRSVDIAYFRWRERNGR